MRKNVLLAIGIGALSRRRGESCDEFQRPPPLRSLSRLRGRVGVGAPDPNKLLEFSRTRRKRER
jgi:hypothetical protein